mgnify:CR=1 FL=1|jgi:putative lipoprotein|tara:strand:+ start:2777 stop:3598 length:822 start_codon:yes stop_codon:yes gene_type:complete
MKNFPSFIVLTVFTALVGLVACSDKSTDSNSQNETGIQTKAALTQLPVVVSYRERIMLPPTATVRVTLNDISRMDVAATIIDQKTSNTQGGPPYHLTMTYDASKIEPQLNYALRAHIEDNGKLLFTNTSAIPAFENNGQPVDILVQGVARQGSVRAPTQLALTNGNWQVKLVSEKSPTMIANGRPISLRLSLKNGQTSGFSGCNTFHGNYTFNDQSLKFSPLASARRACINGSQMAIEQMFLRGITNVDGYTLQRGKLLLTAKNIPIMELTKL